MSDVDLSNNQLLQALQILSQISQGHIDTGKPELVSTPSAMIPYNIGASTGAGTGSPGTKLDWTYEHIRTLIYWMNIANINIFLLDASIQYYKKIVMQVMAFTFLFSSLSTTVSLSQLGISEVNNPKLSEGIKITFVVASTISTILVGYIKLFKVQEMMDADVEMHKEWLEFATRISGELQMPTHLRKPALQLLQDMKASYIGLFCKRPFIPTYVKRYANKYFVKYTQVKNDDSYNDTTSTCLCCTRHNYIKRTNIFFVFQDIMKNEIKRLSAEIELDNMKVNPNDTTIIDGPLAAGTALGAPRLPTSAELKSNIKLTYKYDGPFISIEVIDNNPTTTKTQSFYNIRDASQHAEIDMNYYNKSSKKRGTVRNRGTFLRNFINKESAGEYKSSSDEESAGVRVREGEYRERAHSFQDAERTLYTQMQTNAVSPAAIGLPRRNYKQQDVFNKIKDELISKVDNIRSTSTTKYTTAQNNSIKEYAAKLNISEAEMPSSLAYAISTMKGNGGNDRGNDAKNNNIGSNSIGLDNISVGSMENNSMSSMSSSEGAGSADSMHQGQASHN